MQLGGNEIGGPDVPSIVLFLVCMAQDNLVVQASLLCLALSCNMRNMAGSNACGDCTNWLVSGGSKAGYAMVG